MTSNRITFIDVAKGIGILLVVLGHNDLEDYAPFLFKWIYSFHMPLFFFLAGLFFKPDEPFVQIVTKRFNSLIKPFFITLFLLYFVAAFFSSQLNLNTIFFRLLKSFYGTGFLEWVPMWFLPALFLTYLFAFAFYTLIKKLPHWAVWLGLAGLLTFGSWSIGWFGTFELWGVTLNGLPWSLDLLFITGFYFILGRELFNRLPEKWLAQPWVLLTLIGLHLLSVYLLPTNIDLYKRSYPEPLWATLIALSGIGVVLTVSFWLEKLSTNIAGFFRYIGSAAIIILIFHIPVQYYFSAKLQSVLGSFYSPLMVYPFAVAIPVFIYAFFIQPNPLLARWYGISQKD